MAKAAFVSHAPILNVSRRACTRCSNNGRAKRPRMSRWSFDHIPDWVKELDKRELGRRAKLSMNPPPQLPPDVIERLHEKCEEMAEIDAMFNEENSEVDLQQPYSRIYLLERPWIPNNAFIVVCVALTAFCIRRAYVALEPHISVAAVTAFLLKLDAVMTATLFVAAPLLFLIATLVRPRDEVSDAIARTTGMVLCAAALLAPGILLLGTHAPRAALLLSAVARCISIPSALWLWRDLRDDVSNGSDSLSFMVRVWRIVTTVACAIGVAFRMHPHAPGALQGVCEQLLVVRLALSNRFPVMLSALRDTGALHMYVTLTAIFALAYALHVLIVSTDWLRIREHRSANTILSRVLASLRLFALPDPYPHRSSSAPPGVESYRPARAMLFHRVEGLFDDDAALVTDENRPAIFDLFDDEERVMEEKGITEWMPPRNELVVPTESMSEYDISMQSLLTWSRALSEEQQKQSFSDFFDMLGQDDYDYDADSDSWVFTDSFTTRLNDENEIESGNGARIEIIKADSNTVEKDKKSDDDDGVETIFV